MWHSLSQKVSFSGNQSISSTYSIGAGSYATATFAIPPSREVVSLMGFTSGNYYIAVTEIEVRNGSANMRLFNETNQVINNQTATVVVNTRPIAQG